MANTPSNRFGSKVKYEYNVYLEVLNLKLGEASLSIKDSDNIEGINVYHLNFNVRTTKLGDSIYKIRNKIDVWINQENLNVCLLYTSPSPRDRTRSRMPSSA